MAYSKIEVIPLDNTGAETKTGQEKTVSVGALGKDETELLKAYRKAKKLGYADIAVTIQEGKRVKLWLTEKIK